MEKQLNNTAIIGIKNGEVLTKSDEETSNNESSPLFPRANVKQKLSYTVTPAMCIRNNVMIAVIYLVGYSASNAIINVLSSISVDGTRAFSLTTFLMLVGCLLAPIATKIFGPRLLMFFGWTNYIIFIGALFYPRVYTLYPAAVVVGFCLGLSVNVQTLYTNNTAIKYAQLTGKSAVKWLELSNGLLFTAVALAQIPGNLMSSLTLMKGYNASEPFQNHSGAGVCGAQFCPSDADAGNTSAIVQPSQSSVYLMLSLSVGLMAISIVMIALGLNKLDYFVDVSLRRQDTATWKKLLSPFSMFKDLNMLLFIPSFIYVGIEEAVITADYTQAYLSCSLGVYYIGYVMMGWGVASALGSIAAGVLVPYIGRGQFCVAMLLVIGGLHAVLLTWKVDNAPIILFYAIPMAWAFADGVFRTLQSALVGMLFYDKQDDAYAIYSMGNVLGVAIVYGYTTLLCVKYKIYISIGFLCFALVTYAILEVRARKYNPLQGSLEINSKKDEKDS